MRLCCTGRESPPCDDVSGGGPPLRPKGATALLHREGEPRPPPSTQCNFRRQTEGSHCDRREPWPCCTGRGSPVRCWMSQKDSEQVVEGLSL
ncbi:hypothetical protein ROHU_007151 [Labeo rohita]|uniref:Uncharacterized protein n=1 Tax=Labeo rohita TaxID=84645 RepID=A0A498MKR5_LABRO|nr:hypothetical protein ROHU_007151 [Labeo rohita]